VNNVAGCAPCSHDARDALARYRGAHASLSPGELLELAIREHQRDVVLGILDGEGLDVNTPVVPSRSTSVSPLMTALRACDAAIASLVAARPGFDLARSLSPFATYAWAGTCGTDVVTSYLALPGTDVNAADGNGETLLHEAARAGAVDTVRELLRRPGIAVDAPSGGGTNPLHVAAVAGHDEIVALLLAHGGVDVDNRNNSNRWTVLMDTIGAGHVAVAQRLIALDRLDAAARDDFGVTALHAAAQRGQTDVVAALVARKDVAINAKDHMGRTPLSVAAFQGHTAVVDRLLGRADLAVNLVDRDRQTPLWWAAAGQRLDTVRRLLDDPRTDVTITNRPARDTARSAAASLRRQDIVDAIDRRAPKTGAADQLAPGDDYVERSYTPPAEYIEPDPDVAPDPH
jgi:ankyrin repeat protein